jgi:hypothetical protein
MNFKTWKAVEEDLWEVLGYFIKVYWFRALGDGLPRSRRPVLFIFRRRGQDK